VPVLDYAAPAVSESNDRVAVSIDSLPHYRPDHSVQSWAIAPTAQNPDSTHVTSVLCELSHLAPRRFSLEIVTGFEECL
jgi:hypothetical protein